MPEAASHPLSFKKRTAIALANQRLGVIMDTGTRRQDGGRRAILPELPHPLETRELAARIKDHTLQNLDRYLKQLADNIRKLGGHVHFAETGEQANEIIAGIARAANV